MNEWNGMRWEWEAAGRGEEKRREVRREESIISKPINDQRCQVLALAAKDSCALSLLFLPAITQMIRGNRSRAS